MTRNFAAWPIILILLVLSLPLVVMYLFLVIDTFTNAPVGSILPNEFTLQHWRFLIDPTITGDVWKPTLTTFLFAISMVVIVVSVSATAGYALSRLALPFRRFLLSGILVMHAFPSVTLIIGVFLVLQFAGLYNSLIGVVLVKSSLMLPFGIWIMKGFYDAVPWEIEMAGVQDGASRFTVWRRLILPQVRPGLLSLAIFAFIDGWSEYMLPRILAPSSDFEVLSVYLNTVSDPNSSTYNFNIFKSVGLFYTLPILALFIVFQNRLMNIFGGGTKG
ncbi:carbohydrate ABC transporter permease [Neorhizobium sp. Rsf11]|uniref:Maltose/maltodextrin transport system permease protein MalG n=2 Tax=Neorhizobium TaxID=1525371 RepID=A0ABV0MD03_9HYPH|nr:carbohydrate ABC transporter permease [Neorhizobium petrolearium]MCC2614126.1 carbohydrate ABC transporter permease [Neorhizobium petrolearium]WGI71641.1 carbohydrate ABC transporter permease [Neorhizobium petrolearium]